MNKRRAVLIVLEWILFLALIGNILAMLLFRH